MRSFPRQTSCRKFLYIATRERQIMAKETTTKTKKRRPAPKKPSENYILTYYQGIKNGSIVVGRWIELVYDKIIQLLEDGEIVFDAKRAQKAITYIESHCYHTEGPLAPSPLILELWQRAMVSCIFGLRDPERDCRAFSEVIALMGRKNGKSALAAAIAKYAFMEESHEPGGFGSRVYVIAPKLDQAEIIYNNIWQMVLLDDDWNDLPKDDPNKARHRMTDYYLPATNSTVKKIAFSARKSDGFNPSLTLLDEVASWPGANGLKQYEVLKSGMGARPDALMLSCTTSGYENDGIFDELMKRATRYLLGESKERRLLPFLYMIDDPERWNDINELQKSNPNLGVSISVPYLLEEIAIAEGSLSKKAEFMTKYCNLKQSSSLAWLSAQDVEAAYGKPLNLEDFRSHYAVAGIDLSQSRDLTACCVIIEKSGELYVFAHFFLPANRIDEAIQRDGIPYDLYIKRGQLTLSGESYVDYHDVYKWFTDLVERHEILPLQVGYDRYGANYLCGPNGEMETYGFHCDDVYQGDNLWNTIQETQSWIEDRKFHIGDNDLLKIHLLNTAIKMSAERGRGRIIKLASTDHIDGTAAVLDAMVMRQKYYPEIGDRLRNGA